MEQHYPIRVPVSEIRLADVVKLYEGPWGFAIVTQVTDDSVIITRPYGTTADFSYAGGAIFYTGQELCTYFKNDPRALEVWERKNLK